KKSRSVGKLRNAILKVGFKFPIYLWVEGKYIMDGAGRFMVLEMLDYEGYTIPDIPYVPIKAKNIKEAKEATLLASSKYGKETAESVSAFIQGFSDEELDIFQIDGFDLFEVELKPNLPKEIDLDDEPQETKKGKTKM